MGQLFSNNAKALLVSGILSTDTSLTVEAGKAYLFPTANTGAVAVSQALNWFKITLQDTLGATEIAYVRTRADGSVVMSNILRGQEGTTAIAFASGAVCSVRVTAYDMNSVPGAASSGANSNITSLSGLTTALSVNQGGTGSITASGARTALGAAASGANTDITSLSAPALGSATATTQTAGDNSTKVATTAFVTTAFVAPDPTPQLQPITASIATNAITVVASALSLDFRSTTLTSGAVTRVSGTPASLVIAATDSFGLVTAYGNQRIAILAINNAGTIELAASALYGGVSLDETGVITTAATSTTATEIKAANVRTGVSYRVIGFIDATFTTATGWGSLAVVQGVGGQALSAMSSLGYGQTWQDVTGSRVIGTTYYNTTGRPIQISTVGLVSNGGNGSITIGSTTIQIYGGSTASGLLSVAPLIIPAAASYSIAQVSGSLSIYHWYELR